MYLFNFQINSNAFLGYLIFWTVPNSGICTFIFLWKYYSNLSVFAAFVKYIPPTSDRNGQKTLNLNQVQPLFRSQQRGQALMVCSHEQSSPLFVSELSHNNDMSTLSLIINIYELLPCSIVLSVIFYTWRFSSATLIHDFIWESVHVKTLIALFFHRHAFLIFYSIFCVSSFKLPEGQRKLVLQNFISQKCRMITIINMQYSL